MCIIFTAEQSLEDMKEVIDDFLCKQVDDFDNFCITTIILGDLQLIYAEDLQNYVNENYECHCYLGQSTLPVRMPKYEYSIPASTMYMKSKTINVNFSLN